MDNFSLVGSRLHLAPLSRLSSNLDLYLSWLRDSYSNPFIYGVRGDFTMQELLSYIDEKDVSEDAILWGIRRNEDSILVGTVKLEPINLSDGSAWLGIMIGDVNSRAKGYGTEATKLVLDFARDRLNLNKIYLGVHVENQLALKMYKKIGFEELKTELNQLKMLKRL